MEGSRIAPGTMNRIVVCLRFLLAVVFLWAGMAKMRDPFAFADGVADFQIFPDATANVIAMCVPAVELAAGVLLLSGRWRRQGALLTGLLSGAFVALFAWTLMQGREVECSCFGATHFLGSSAISGLIRAVVLFAACVAVYLANLRVFPADGRVDN